MNIDQIQNQIKQLRTGLLSSEKIRKLPTEIGRANWKAGIPTVLDLAASSDHIVRYNAIMCLAYAFEYREAKTDLVRLLKDDPDDDCREAAAGGLGFLFRRTQDCSLMKLLGKVACSDREEYVRETAFTALLRISGRADEERILTEHPRVDEDVIEDILSRCRQVDH